MKSVKIAALASLFLFGSAFADTAMTSAPESTPPASAVMNALTAADCQQKIGACNGDSDCLAKLAEQGCKPADAGSST